jgi:hypothetical protein
MKYCTLVASYWALGRGVEEVQASIDPVEGQVLAHLGARVGKVIRGGQEVGGVGGCPKGGQNERPIAWPISAFSPTRQTQATSRQA